MYIIFSAEDFLDQAVNSVFPEHSTRSETIRNFLKKHDLIFDGDRATIYNNRIKVLQYEKLVLEVASSTNVVVSDGIFKETNQTQLIKVIDDLISQYSSYALSVDHVNFNGYDNSFYNSMVGGNDPTNGILNIGGSITGTPTYVNHPEILAADVLVIINKLTSALEDANISTADTLKLKDILNKLKGDTTSTRNPYERLFYFGNLSDSSNKAVVFSKAIPTAEILQIISDNKTIIKKWTN